MTSARDLQEMIEYAEVLKEGFNPSSVEDLHALLYLIYYDYKYCEFGDKIFSENLMALIERCKEVQPQEPIVAEPCGCCPPPAPQHADYPIFEYNPDRYVGPGNEKIPQDFVQFAVQRLFYEGNERIPRDILGREMRRFPIN